jgi:hypothetical protein
MTVVGARNQIEQTILGWAYVEKHPHRFGGNEYRIGKREIGHMHGDYLLDIPLPKKVRDEIVTTGKAQAHHILPESGWISLYIREQVDVQCAIELLKLSYDFAIKQKGLSD